VSRIERLTLRGDDLEVVVLPGIGARLHRIRAFGEDLLRTPADTATHLEEPFFWGAFPMAPWCNRAPAGRSEVAGRTVRLTPNFADGTAIHGLVSWTPWAHDDGSLHVEAGGNGWPWRHQVVLVPSVAGRTLELDYRLTNLAPEPMPAGIGLHPWFRSPVEVRLPADAVYESNSASAAEPRSVAGAVDLRRIGRPSTGLDGTWTSLRERTLELRWPDLGIRAVVEMESATASACVALASPATPDAVAVEPQTHGPDPLRRLANGEPDAPILLPRGETLRFVTRLTVERPAPVADGGGDPYPHERLGKSPRPRSPSS
jgi:aldose 1-epimerase